MMNRTQHVLLYFLIVFYGVTYGYKFNGDVSAKIQNDSYLSFDIKVKTDNTTASNFSNQLWITQIFSDGERNFDMNANVTAACKRDFEFYKLNLRNLTVWAIRMLESSEWPSVGIFAGMTYHLGNYKECVMVSKHRFSGQYCLVNAAYDIPQQRNTKPAKFADENDSVWNAIKQYQENPWRQDRQNISWAMCIPDSCQISDLENSVRHVLHPLFVKNGLNVSVQVIPNLCTTSKPEDFPLETYLFSSFVVIFIGVLIVCTVYDFTRPLKSEKKSTSQQIYECFSITRNFKNLIRVSSNDSPMLYLIKVLITLAIIHGHRSIYIIGFPKFNSEMVENVGRTIDTTVCIIFFMLDFFFMISGFIVFHFGLAKVRDKGYIAAVQNFILRWAKMIPVFALIMLFMTYIFPFISSGPIWKYRVQEIADNCHLSFWPNIFAVGNIFRADKMCMFTSWYISADIQLTLIGCILLTIFVKNEKSAIYCMIVLLVLGAVISFIVTYKNYFHVIVPLYISTMERPWQHKEVTDFYILPFSRIGSYLAGIGAAVLTKKLREKNKHFSDKHLAMVIVVGLISKLALICYFPYSTDLLDNQQIRLQNSFSAAFFRLLFVLPEAMLLCVYFTSASRTLLRYFDFKIFVPIGRLLYGVYLIHPVVQLYYMASHQVPVPFFSIITYTWDLIGDYFWSFFFAFLLHIIAEAPIANLSRLVVSSTFNKTNKVHINGAQTVFPVESVVLEKSSNNTFIEQKST